MIQKKFTIIVSLLVVILNFTTATHAIRDDDGGITNTKTDNTSSALNVGTNYTRGNGYPVDVNTTLNTDGWLYTVTLLKDDCLDDFMKAGFSIKNRFTQLADVYNKDYENEIPDSSSAARTFGLRKRIMSMALPLMFKLGVMFTVIMTILVLVIKAVIIGKMILLLNVIGIVLKLVSLKYGHGGGGEYKVQTIPVALLGGGYGGGHGGGWDTHGPHKEIHLHIHNNGGEHSTGYGSIPSAPPSYGPVSRNDVHHQTLVVPSQQQAQSTLQRLIPYDPYANHYSSNEYILV